MQSGYVRGAHRHDRITCRKPAAGLQPDGKLTQWPIQRNEGIECDLPCETGGLSDSVRDVPCRKAMCIFFFYGFSFTSSLARPRASTLKLNPSHNEPKTEERSRSAKAQRNAMHRGQKSKEHQNVRDAHAVRCGLCHTPHDDSFMTSHHVKKPKRKRP